jgi:hypothetical protein
MREQEPQNMYKLTEEDRLAVKKRKEQRQKKSEERGLIVLKGTQNL